MNISKHEVLDYMSCPIYHKLMHIHKIEQLDSNQSLTEHMQHIINYILLKQMTGSLPPMHELKQKWDGICTKERLSDRKIKDGITYLYSIVRYLETQKLTVLDVNQHASLLIDEHVIVDTNIPAIIEEQGKLFLFYVDCSSKTPSQELMDSKLSYTIDYFAFEQKNNKALAGIKVLSCKTMSTYVTTRRSSSNESLSHSIRSAVNGITSEWYYPVQKSLFCTMCGMSYACKQLQRG